MPPVGHGLVTSSSGAMTILRKLHRAAGLLATDAPEMLTHDRYRRSHAIWFLAVRNVSTTLIQPGLEFRLESVTAAAGLCAKRSVGTEVFAPRRRTAMESGGSAKW
jgi:hypothetical protein